MSQEGHDDEEGGLCQREAEKLIKESGQSTGKLGVKEESRGCSENLLRHRNCEAAQGCPLNDRRDDDVA